ncbi:NADP-dependent oxidoreductase [Microbispora sp. ATCC PTA-5024]|uniref:NADP-dependent oxidoreductase n=1 Tax=Microbispora sp. ATCC PTA-5024 TaxID=316330 RepID=UPI0003DDA0AE|nr:NADP-dependent oxidoreductase [Microbispora sp. ATCC PTA-5024]ETK36672.1 NADPH:quinone reductase [Microbispora sp. ATCC PTA-5024]
MRSSESSTHLVYLVTYWREWRLWGPGGGEADDRLIRELLESSDSADPKVWLATSPDGLLDKVTWLSGNAALRELEEGNAKVDQANREIEARYLDAADSLDWYHVLIHPDHQVGPFKQEGKGRKPWILFDIQFRNRWSSRMMFIGVSFWVGDPVWAPTKAGGWLSPHEDDRKWHEWFVNYARQSRAHVGGHFRKMKQEIREYEAPEFWIALQGDVVRKQQELQSARDLYKAMHWTDQSPMEDRRSSRREPARHDDDPLLSSADVLVVPTRRGDRTVRECYVVLPDTTPLNGTLVGERLRSAVAGLLTLETLAAAGNDIRDQLEVWREHAVIYQHAARTTGALWDGVASHLPIRRWIRLHRAHRAVELIHLTLLQGMADLADVSSHVDEGVSRLQRLEHLADERFTATLGWAGRGLREALDDVSHFTDLRRFGERAGNVAERATEQYKNLLESISHAFDERRVRELEVLQRAGFWLSVAVGAFAVLTFLDFFMENKNKMPASSFWMSGRELGVGAWGILAVLALGVLGSWGYSLWSRRMGTRWFHRTFRELEWYLRLSSTHELELVRGRIRAPEDWEEHDRDLANRFADLWDASKDKAERSSSSRPRVPRRARRSSGLLACLDAKWVTLWGMWWTGRDLTTQSRDIEALIVRTLLLAERTPTLRRYGLPRLTLLHRHCGRLPSNWFGDFDGVSKTELRMVLASAGFAAEVADRVDAPVAERIAFTKAVAAGRIAREEADRKADTKITTAQELLTAIEEELAGTRAARIHTYGGPEVIRYERVRLRDPGPGEVLIRVAATSFNPSEAGLRSGMLRGALQVALPYTLGWDVAGTVAAVGAGVSKWMPGDQVIGRLDAGGAAAEYALAPAEVLAPAPTAIPLAHAAAIPVAALTAWQAVYEHAEVTVGQRVLINGAGGGVGGFAVQFAKRAGATVIATASLRSADVVRSLGADQIVDYMTVPLPGGMDKVINLAAVSPQQAAKLTALVRPGGVVVSTTTPPVPGARHLVARNDPHQLTQIAKLVDAWQLTVDVAESRPLTDLASVHLRSEAGQTRGKIILIP